MWSSINAKEINKCLSDIAHQCVLHKGKGFIFPTENIRYEDDFNSHSIEWAWQDGIGGIFAITNIGKIAHVKAARDTFKNILERETGLKCNYTHFERCYGLTVIVSNKYSNNIYEKYLKENIDKSIIKESTELTNEFLEMAKKFQIEVIRNNNDTIIDLALKMAKNFGQTFCNITKDGLEITGNDVKDIIRKIPFADYGLQPLSEEYQMYGIARAIAMEISCNTLYPFERGNNGKKYYVKLTLLENSCWITQCSESIKELKPWG